jgi:hypothetical protein
MIIITSKIDFIWSDNFVLNFVIQKCSNKDFKIKMDRWEWIDAFKQINLSTVDVMKMNDEEFYSNCRYLTENGLAPTSIYNSQFNESFPENINEGKQLNSAVSRNNQNIRMEQDKEFQKALEEEQMNNEMVRMAEFREKQKVRIDQEEKEQNEKIRLANKRKASKIKNEGDIQIAFILPNQKRILNKFYSHSLGDDLYSFVANQEEMYDEKGYFQPFTLVHGLNQIIKPEFLLSEQDISGRAIVNILLD